MLVELLKNEKHQLQEEMQKYKQMQRNLEVKALKLDGSWWRMLATFYNGDRFEMSPS